TANRDMAAELFENPDPSLSILHVPLESYSAWIDKELESEVTKRMDEFKFVLHGNLRNTRFFTNWMNKQKLAEKFRKMVHLAVDAPTAAHLESAGLPAIQPKQEGKAIDVLEFMLRISREGLSLYPAIEGEQEELPALLGELDLPVVEFTVCREDRVSESDLKTFRNQVDKEEFSHILIHNRGALTRIRTAFPGLNLKKSGLISGSPGVTTRLIEEGLEPLREASGTWISIREILNDLT
ncbi:MAG: hypothetical protein R3283_01915, partial [Balneolaceae bacterium]|nr:hypothetical protein [Balneolaceae bacterium]